MSDVELRRYFESVLLEGAPDTVDVEEAMVEGRGRRRRRQAVRAGVAGAAMVVVVVAAAWGSGVFDRSRPTPAATRTPTAGVSSTAHTVTSVDELLGYWHTIELDGRDVSHDGSVGDPLMLWFTRRGDQLSWAANDGCNETTGRFHITPAGILNAEEGRTTLLACPSRAIQSRNTEVAPEATRARIADQVGELPRRLELMAGDRVIAIYEETAKPPMEG